MDGTITPPTDNLYKFLAIGGLAFALVAFVFLLREHARLSERYMDAQVELQAGGYEEGSGAPEDRELRRAYFRREATRSEFSNLLDLSRTWVSRTMGFSAAVSIGGFVAWWRRVQRYDDAILRATLAKLQREERAAADPSAPATAR